jgi:uncharacterized protein RhaS with RHS repeats
MRKTIFAIGVAVLAVGCASEPIVETARRQNTYDSAGRLVGYEERIAGRTILFDLKGRPVGERWQDLRNDGSNPGNAGISVIVQPEDRSKQVD